ncbi:MAG: terminase large subunit [Verrucomicrobiota bacterium]
MTSSPRGKAKPKQIQGWPPRYLSPVSPADLKRSRGDHVIDFAQALCTITKDSIAGNAGTRLVLRDWQKELLRNLYAEKADGTLRHSRALIGVSRKNGKSALLAALVLEHLVFGVSGGEVYSAAADKEQAKIIFNTVRDMIKNAPDLSEFLEVFRDSIYNPKNGTVYRALSSEAFTKEGLSATFVAMDELHAQQNRELYDVLSLSMGARKEGMLVAITTAGVMTGTDGKPTICHTLYEYGKRVTSEEVVDPSFFFSWWEPNDPNASHYEESTWMESNPGYGDIVSKESFIDSISMTPEAEFRTKRCNQWVATSDTWLPHGSFDAIADATKVIADGSNVVLGFDGSFNGDCTAIVAISCEENPHIEVVACWEKPDEAQADWQVPIQEVEDTIRDACAKYQVLEVACDPYRWARTFQVLEEENIPVVAFPQTATRMTPATTRMFEAVVNKSITQSGDPQLARHFANATLRVDQRGTRLAKEKRGSLRRIDLAVAAVMSLERATWHHSQGNFISPLFDPWKEETV